MHYTAVSLRTATEGGDRQACGSTSTQGSRRARRSGLPNRAGGGGANSLADDGESDGGGRRFKDRDTAAARGEAVGNQRVVHRYTWKREEQQNNNI